MFRETPFLILAALWLAGPAGAVETGLGKPLAIGGGAEKKKGGNPANLEK